MDIYFNLILVSVIIIMFILMKYTINVYLYIGIIMLSATGLIVATFSPLYLIVGYNTSITYTPALSVLTYPIQQELSIYNYIFQLYYLMSMLGAILYWTLDSPKKQDY